MLRFWGGVDDGEIGAAFSRTRGQLTKVWCVGRENDWGISGAQPRPAGGALFFSPDGNFIANSDQIGTVNLVTANTFLAEQQVTVVA